MDVLVRQAADDAAWLVAKPFVPKTQPNESEWEGMVCIFCHAGSKVAQDSNKKPAETIFLPVWPG